MVLLWKEKPSSKLQFGLVYTNPASRANCGMTVFREAHFRAYVYRSSNIARGALDPAGIVHLKRCTREERFHE